jgi:hypothetical protein
LQSRYKHIPPKHQFEWWEKHYTIQIQCQFQPKTKPKKMGMVVSLWVCTHKVPDDS